MSNMGKGWPCRRTKSEVRMERSFCAECVGNLGQVLRVVTHFVSTLLIVNKPLD